MNLRTFFCKSVLGAGSLALCISLAVGLFQPTQTEAFSLGKIGGILVNTAVEQAKVKESLDYYENSGRNELF